MKKTAVVTGGSKGLGRTIATFLARAGYEVVITGRDEARLVSTARDLRSEGGRIVPIAGDVTDERHRAAVAEAVGEGLDILVNNASELGPSPMPSLASYDVRDLRRVFEVNVIAPVAIVQALLPALRARHGLVVNITSDAAVGAYPGWGGYGASKAAIDLISRTLAAECADGAVRVVAVDPGDLRTDMHQAAFPGEDISDRPLPDVTIPFWAWLFATDDPRINGGRFQAQAEAWGVAS